MVENIYVLNVKMEENTKNTKQDILEALQDEEERLMGFRIEIKGNSGNCSINQGEKELICNQIVDVLKNRGIHDFEIGMDC